MITIRIPILGLVALLACASVSAKAADLPNGAPNRPPKATGDLVPIEGGIFRNPKSASYYGRGITLSGFYIGKYEVTQKQWADVMGSNPSHFKGDDLPVEMVSWYDCVEYCNRRSLKEGLKPCYTIDQEKKDPNNRKDPHFEMDFDPLKWTVTVNPGADGYRLPTEAEWEYAAGGGQASKHYTYSGSDELDAVAWFYQNSGDTPLPAAWHRHILEKNHDRTHPVGSKQPNELGLYDMSGNVREWCWDWYGDLSLLGGRANPEGNSSGSFHVWKGGCWMASDFSCATSFRGSNNPSNYRSNDQGLRVCRSKL